MSKTPKSPRELAEQATSNIQLNILVFGPQVTHDSEDPVVRALQAKRKEIKSRLIEMGHNAKYAEELVEPDLEPPFDNILVQERFLMQEYDLVFVLVDQPGSISEATEISGMPDLARKAYLFINRDYEGGVVYQTCLRAERIGAKFKPYEYPRDLVDCHLLGFICDHVRSTQLVHLMS